jgi:hypothetical protein
MMNAIDLETLDVMKFARSIESDCQESVKWEHRKLRWILEEEAAAQNREEGEDASL